MPANAIDENGNEHANVSSSIPRMFKIEDPYPGWNSTNTTLADVMADKGTGDLKALYVYMSSRLSIKKVRESNLIFYFIFVIPHLSLY